MLTPAELEGMRATHADSLPDRVSVYRRRGVSDGGGAKIYTWYPVLADIPARVGVPERFTTGEQGESGGRLSDEEKPNLYFGAYTDVGEADMIRDDATGQWYEVNAVLRRGGWEIGRRCRVTEADPPPQDELEDA